MISVNSQYWFGPNTSQPGAVSWLLGVTPG
jgi:hypothetical protein